MVTAPKVKETGLTVEDYMQIDDDQRHELINGRLVVDPSPNVSHQRVITRIGTFLDTHVMENDLGECFHAPFDVVLSENTVLQPDFTFVSKERFDELRDDHTITGPPDLVIEVLSPSKEKRDRHHKRAIYSEAGVSGCFLLSPTGRSSKCNS